MRSTLRFTVLAAISLGVVATMITGCGTGFSNAAANNAQAALGTIKGSLYGGQQPVVGSHVYVYAAGTTGYGGASTSLLTAVPGMTTADGNGNYYVTTDSNGGFTVTGDYQCVSGTQVYVYAVGGNAGGGVNSGAGFLALAGQCPSSGTLASSVPFIALNEASTVAAANAFAGFAVDPTHVSSPGTALAQTGIANAFANAGNLVGRASGLSLATTPAGNGTVPTAKVNTLANILAACVNSNGPSSTPCALLFLGAQSQGSSGTQPTDTAGAAINIAHNPSANVQFLFYIQSATGAPFQPSLTTQPNDFTLAVAFTGGGISNSTALAIDGLGNAFTLSSNNIAKLSPLGVALSGSGGFTTGLTTASALAVRTDNNVVVAGTAGGSGAIAVYGNDGTPVTAASVATPYGLAVDGSNRAFFGTQTGCGGSCYKLDRLTGTAVAASPLDTPGGYSGPPTFAAIDGLGNLWTSSANSVISEVDGNLNPISPAAGYTTGLNVPYGIAIDAANNVWNANYGNSSIGERSNSGTRLSPSNGYAGGGLSGPRAIAIDGLGNVWAANYTGNSISEFQNNGIPISNTGYISSSLSNPVSLAIDESGDVWVGNGTAQNVTEFIGSAAPVIAPLATAASQNKLGTRP